MQVLTDLRDNTFTMYLDELSMIPTLLARMLIALSLLLRFLFSKLDLLLKTLFYSNPKAPTPGIRGSARR